MYHIFINGKWCQAKDGKTFKVINPANGKKLTMIPNGTRAGVKCAIDAADSALVEWAGCTAYERSRIPRRAYDLMCEKSDHLARTMTEEEGKPLKAAESEIKYGADFLL